MSYYGLFQNAKNYKGELLRDPDSRNLIQYCLHIYKVHPVFKTIDESVANTLFYSKQHFSGLEGCCILCGETITINVEDIVSEENFYKQIEEHAKNACQSEEEKTNGNKKNLQKKKQKNNKRNNNSGRKKRINS